MPCACPAHTMISAWDHDDDPNDPLIIRFQQCLATLEQLIYEKHGKKIPASYTRRKIQNKGVRQSLIDWALMDGGSDGFATLCNGGLSEFTGEALIADFPERFSDAIVARARRNLELAGITPPTGKRQYEPEVQPAIDAWKASL